MASSVVCGRVTIDFDLARAPGQRVRHEDVRVDGQRAIDAFVEAWNAAGADALGKTQGLLFELFDAVYATEAVAPLSELVFRDAADRVQEAVVSLVWRTQLSQNRNNEAMEYCLYVLQLCHEWEAHDSKRYIHKGVPYFFAGIAALRCRNLDFAMLLFEAGDHSDSDTHRRAGLSEAGYWFPGRALLALHSTPYNLVQNDVMALRTRLDGWLKDFNAKAGAPVSPLLDLAGLDKHVFEDHSLETTTRHVLAYLIRGSLLDSHPALSKVKAVGPYARRMQAVYLLGMRSWSPLWRPGVVSDVTLGRTLA